MDLKSLEGLVNGKNFQDSIVEISKRVKGKIVFSTSFGQEDQVIYHQIFAGNIQNIEVFTLDTGRLFPETYKVWDETESKYGRKIKAYYPQADELETFINGNGINSFYASTELRKTCCVIRKVNPLKRALEGATLWITGLRAEQSENRHQVNAIEWDEKFKVFKFNPLVHWSSADVHDYIQHYDVPYNELHDQGYVSIGCAPCTRAIEPGEDFRSGRWWWEDSSKKECGLHK